MTSGEGGGSDLHQLLAHGDGDGFGAVDGTELGEDRDDVLTHAVGLDVELRGDLLVALAAGHCLEDLALAVGQFRGRRIVCDHLRNLRRNIALALGDGPDGREQRLVGRRLGDGSIRAGCERGGKVVRHRGGRQNQHLCFGELLLDLGGRGDAVLAGHQDVHDDDVRTAFPDHADGGVSVVRLADDDDAAA